MPISFCLWLTSSVSLHASLSKFLSIPLFIFPILFLPIFFLLSPLLYASLSKLFLFPFPPSIHLALYLFSMLLFLYSCFFLYCSHSPNMLLSYSLFLLPFYLLSPLAPSPYLSSLFLSSSSSLVQTFSQYASLSIFI